MSTKSQTTVPLGRVISDLAWLQRFATALARNPDDAEDLVQETLLTAWRAPALDDGRSLRPWLAAVMRNRHRAARRGEGRRDRREQVFGAAAHVAGELASKQPDAEVQRLEVLEALVAEIRRLQPDDQELVIRRYFDGESAADIARDLGLAAATVRSRVRRSLQRIKASLDGEFGRRDTWSAAVLAAAPPATVTATATATAASSMPSWALGLAKFGLASSAAAALGFMVCGPDRVQDSGERDGTSEARAQVAGAPDEAKALLSEPPKPEASRPDEAATRREAIRAALPQAAAGDELDPDAPTASGQDASQRRAAYRRLRARLALAVGGCVDDLDARAVGSLTLSLVEIGAPDLGTVYESIEVDETNVEDPELIECIVQSLYAHVGEPPAEAYRRGTTVTSKVGSAESRGEQLKQGVGFIVGAHSGEIRVCGEKHAPGIEGQVTFDLRMGTDRMLESATPGPTTLPPEPLECMTERMMAWKWPKDLVEPGESFEYTFVLPMAGQAPFLPESL